MDGLVSFIVMIGTILFYYRRYRIVPNWSRALDPRMVFDGVADLVDGELERSEVLCRLEGSKWIR